MKFRVLGKQKIIFFWLSRSLVIFVAFCLVLINLHLGINFLVKLPKNARVNPEAILVLGGSISREIHAAKLAKQNPELPILIARGSADPCIYKIFRRSNTPMKKVWLEICSSSTFSNFVFSLPALQDWQVRKVKLITSGTHIRRSQWLARIMLGAHGIWVDLDIAPEKGVPGNHESLLKTGVDLSRALLWSYISQIIRMPRCDRIYPLSQVNLSDWENRKYACERQGKIK